MQLPRLTLEISSRLSKFEVVHVCSILFPAEKAASIGMCHGNPFTASY